VVIFKNQTKRLTNLGGSTALDTILADFYCPAKKLIIELDGNPHTNEAQKHYDLIT
jgi:very-short-patch-repair endonuclease